VTDDEGATRRYWKASTQISGLSATITVQIPAGITTLLVKPPFGLSDQFSVTPGEPFAFSFARPDPAADEHPKMILYIGAPGETDYPVVLNFVREGGEGPADPVPVTLASAPTLASTGITGGSVTGNVATWAGDFTATENFIFTGATEGSATNSTGNLWTEVPTGLTGQWFRLGSRAYGPTVADPNVLGWTDWAYSAAILIVPIPAARQLTTSDITILRSVYRPTNQTTHFTPIIAIPGLVGVTVNAIEFTAADPGNANPSWNNVVVKADEPGAYELFDKAHPVAVPTSDGALFQDGNIRRTRFRIRWRGAADQPWSEPSPVFNLPNPTTVTPDRPLAEIFNPQQAMVQEAINYNRALKFEVNFNGRGGGEGGHVPIINAYAKHIAFMPVLDVWAGNNRTYTVNGNARTAKAQTLQNLLLWANDAGDSAPACRDGYSGQHEVQVVCTIALARITPAIWDDPSLLPKYKTRLDLLMKGFLASSAAVASKWIPFDRGYGNGRERTIRGYSAGSNNAPNFSSPPRLKPYIVAAYMEANGESAEAFMTNFNRATFHAQLVAAGGLLEARATFAQDWTEEFQAARYGVTLAQNGSFGPGHTADQLKRTLNNNNNPPWLNFSGNYRITQYREVFATEIERTFNREVVPGPTGIRRNNNGTGAFVGEAGPGWDTLHGVKITDGNQTAGQLRACLGRPTTAGQNNSPTVKTEWATLPNAGLIGMHNELWTGDAGESGGPNVRSAPTYAISGLYATIMMLATIIIYGKLAANDTIFNEAKARFAIGMRDINFRAKYGHRGYAKGGFPSDNNEDFGPAWLTAQGARWASFMHLAGMIAEWWGLDPFPTDD